MTVPCVDCWHTTLFIVFGCAVVKFIHRAKNNMLVPHIVPDGLCLQQTPKVEEVKEKETPLPVSECPQDNIIFFD